MSQKKKGQRDREDEIQRGVLPRSKKCGNAEKGKWDAKNDWTWLPEKIHPQSNGILKFPANGERETLM